MGESAALHAINLVVHTAVVVLLLAVLSRILVQRRKKNGAVLQGLALVFWSLFGFFGLVWLGRVEAILDPLPDIDVLMRIRQWIFLPELVLVYGLTRFWHTIRRKD